MTLSTSQPVLSELSRVRIGIFVEFIDRAKTSVLRLSPRVSFLTTATLAFPILSALRGLAACANTIFITFTKSRLRKVFIVQPDLGWLESLRTTSSSGTIRLVIFRIRNRIYRPTSSLPRAERQSGRLRFVAQAPSRSRSLGFLSTVRIFFGLWNLRFVAVLASMSRRRAYRSTPFVDSEPELYTPFGMNLSA